jgi:hypothetical protein
VKSSSGGRREGAEIFGGYLKIQRVTRGIQCDAYAYQAAPAHTDRATILYHCGLHLPRAERKDHPLADSWRLLDLLSRFPPHVEEVITKARFRFTMLAGSSAAATDGPRRSHPRKVSRWRIHRYQPGSGWL